MHVVAGCLYTQQLFIEKAMRPVPKLSLPYFEGWLFIFVATCTTFRQCSGVFYGSGHASLNYVAPNGRA